MPDTNPRLNSNGSALAPADQASLQGLLASWPRWQLGGGALLSQPPVVAAQLSGGLNHLTFKAVSGSQAFALRLNQPHRRSLAMSLEQELKLLRLASEHGLAPKVLLSEGDWLVSRFIEAPSWQVQIDQSIESLAQQLSNLHRLEITDTGFNLVEHCRGYFDKIPKPNAAQQQLHHQLLRLTQATLTRFPARCLCHNDLNPGNIMLASTPLFIDWEYACSNHPAFDLASVLEWGQLTATQQQRLLKRYHAANEGITINPDCLQAFRLIVRYVEWLWLLQTPEKSETSKPAGAPAQNPTHTETQTCQLRLEQALTRIQP